MVKALLDEREISIFQIGSSIDSLQIASAFKASSNDPRGVNVVIFKNSGLVCIEDEDGQTITSAVNATHKKFRINTLDDAINLADMLCYPEVNNHSREDIIADVVSEIKKGNISYNDVGWSNKENILSKYGLP